MPFLIAVGDPPALAQPFRPQPEAATAWIAVMLDRGGFVSARCM